MFGVDAGIIRIPDFSKYFCGGFPEKRWNRSKIDADMT